MERTPGGISRFVTSPPLVVYMPDERDDAYERTCFRRLRDVLALGGFTTHDLG